MVSEIITNIQALNLAILAELLKQILIKILKVVLDFLRIEVLLLSLRVEARSEHVGALVHVRETNSGANGGFCVETRTAVTMPASSDLEVERTVHSVLLRPEYRSQVLRH